MAWLIYKAVTAGMAGNKDYTKAESIYDFAAKGTSTEQFPSFEILQ